MTMAYSNRYRSHHDGAKALKQKCGASESGEEYLPPILAERAKTPLVIYLHVPFCNKVCSFCPFHRPDALDRREYHRVLIDEIEALAKYPYMKAPVDAVNFGGGTPTALSFRQMDDVLSALHRNFDIRDDAEISVETSATELSDDMLRVLKAGGVNRLSIGVQSFDDEARRLLGRRGGRERAIDAVERALDAGIVNTGIDLIYNYPGQTKERLLSDLAIIRRLGVAGLSFYSLVLHEKTPLYRKLAAEGKLDYADLDREYDFYRTILEELGKSGFAMLELTKLVRNNLDRYRYMELRHSGGSCIAVGQGAGGNIENYYYHNSAHTPPVSDQIAVSSKGRVVLPVFRTLDAFFYEMQEGTIRPAFYAEKLERDLQTPFAPVLGRLAEEGLIYSQNDVYFFTEKGSFWGNNIIDELIRSLLPVV